MSFGIHVIVEGPERLCPSQGETKKNRVPRRDVGHRDAIGHHIRWPILWHLNSHIRQGTPTKGPQVDDLLNMLDNPSGLCDPPSRLNLDRVAHP